MQCIKTTFQLATSEFLKLTFTIAITIATTTYPENWETSKFFALDIVSSGDICPNDFSLFENYNGYD